MQSSRHRAVMWWVNSCTVAPGKEIRSQHCLYTRLLFKSTAAWKFWSLQTFKPCERKDSRWIQIKHRGGRHIHSKSEWEARLFTAVLEPKTSTTLRGEQYVLLRPSWIWACTFQNSQKPTRAAQKISSHVVWKTEVFNGCIFPPDSPHIPNFLEFRPYSTDNTGSHLGALPHLITTQPQAIRKTNVRAP